MKLLLALLFVLALVAQTTSDGPQYTADGHLLLSANYREWIYLSSGLGMTYGPAATADHGNPKFENVFVSRTAYNSFLESGSRRRCGPGDYDNMGTQTIRSSRSLDLRGYCGADFGMLGQSILRGI